VYIYCFGIKYSEHNSDSGEEIKDISTNYNVGSFLRRRFWTVIERIGPIIWWYFQKPSALELLFNRCCGDAVSSLLPSKGALYNQSLQQYELAAEEIIIEHDFCLLQPK
jgi:hypothetical protein